MHLRNIRSSFGAISKKLSRSQKKTRKNRVSRFEQLEQRRVLAAAVWNNVINPLNVNGDAGGFVAPNDVLVIVNELNGPRYSDPATGRLPKQHADGVNPPFLDVSCDGFATPVDALIVVNYINSGAPANPGNGFHSGGGTYSAIGCSPQLLEGTGFSTELSRVLTLPDDSSSVEVKFRAPEFDFTSRRSIRDAFEIEISDLNGNPVAFPYMPNRDAFYNWSEDLEPVFGAGTKTVTEPAGQDSSATVNLSGLAAGSQVRVTVRLVNNDGDDNTSVIVRGFEVVDATEAAPAGVSGGQARASGVAALNFSRLSDISGSFVAQYGRTTLSGDNNELMTDLVVTNRGNQAVTGRILVAIDNISELDANAMHPDGFTPDGLPYFDLTAEMNGQPLERGASLRSREIAFLNNSGRRFTYKLRTLGALNAAPTGFTTQPPASIEAGKTYRYAAQAADPDGQALTYSVVSGPETLRVDAQSGKLTWGTHVADIGSHRVTLRATDPHGLYVEQTFSIEVMETLQNRPPNFVTDPVTDAIASSGFEITTVATGANPAGIGVISGFRGPRLVSGNSGDQTIGVYAGENNDRFDDAKIYSTGFPTADGQLFDVGYAVDIGLPKFTSGIDSNGVTGMDQGDLNGDGILDLVTMFTYDAPGVGQRNQLVITAMLGDGNGSFGSPHEIYRHDIGSSSYEVRNLLLRDINNDGTLDVLAAERWRDPRLITILGNGDGTFAAASEQTFEKTLSDFRTADIDEDGNLDLIGRTAILGFGASYEAVWLRGNGDGSFTEPIVIGPAGSDSNCCYGTQQRPHDVLDLNGDGNLDLVFLTVSGVVIYHSDGNGNFTLASEFNPSSTASYNWIRGGDFNGDGLADLVHHNTWNKHLELLIGSGDGVNFTYQSGPGTDAWLSNYAGTDDPADIDGDGDLDLIFGHSNGDWTSTKVAINDGAGGFSITEYAMVDFSGVIQPFSPGDIARGAMFGDYNRDGVIDFSYFTSGADFNGVGVRLGTRPGEFGQTRTIPWLPGSRAEDAVPGDFNGDGIVDLLDTSNDRIFLGVGDGTYREPFPAVGVSRPTGYGSSADFNLDGIDDVVATRANQNGSRYYVALANGDGTFTVSDDQLVQSSFYGYSSTLIADFNLDGFPDFVAKSSVERQIDVHINDPSNPGVFTRTFRITLPSGSQGTNVSNWQESYAVADFTGDGIPDLAFAERNLDTDNLMKIVVMAGDGLGGFSRHSELAGFDDAFIRATYGASFYSPGDFSAGDINADGSVDLVSVTNAGTRTFLNDGTGNFVAASMLENPGTQQRGRDSWLVDFDEDGHLDLIQASSGGNGPLIVRLGNGDGTFRKPQQVGLVGAIPGNISRQPFADLDGDGHLDFVYATGGVGNYGSDTTSIFAGRRDDLVDLVAVDLNGDGNEDVLAVQEQMDRLQILVSDNLGGFTRQPDLLTGRAPQAVAAVDLDGDGQLELLVANRTSRSLSVFAGTIGVGFTSAEFPVGVGPIDVATADINGDGNQDVFVLDDAENALWLFIGDGSTTLGTPTAFALGDKPSRFSMADATGDGIVDAVITLPNTQRLMILPGDGAGALGSPIYVDLAAAPSDVAIVDLNDDGNPDLATTLTNLNVLSVLYGRGNNQFSQAQHIQVGQAPTRVTLADADKDGRFDFIVANSGDATASVIYNRFDPNEVYRYDADAVDPDDDSLTYAIVDGPGGLIINSQTGALLWAASPDQVGVHNVTISADDGRGGIATQTFKIEVVAARENAAPLIATEPQTTMGAGDTFSYQATALDNDRDALRYRLIDAPPGATVDPTTGLIQWDGRGQALVYAPYGDSGAVAVSTSSALTPENVTVEGWVNMHTLTASNGASVLFSLSGAHGWAYYLRSLFNNRFQLIMDFDGQRVDYQPRFQFTKDKWFHVALSVDDVAKTATILVDGQVVGSTPIPDSIGYANGRTLYVGDHSQFKTLATIETFRVWNVARAGVEIREGMATQYENDPRLVLDYRFQDTRMLSVQDHSTYGNTGFRVSNGLLPQTVDGLTDAGSHTFSVSVEDGRGGYDVQTFELNVLPELRGSVVGHLFDDLDGDGVQDDGSENPAEPSLAGWQLYIDTNGNAYPDPAEPQTITDANGDYRFDGLLPGEYPVRVSPMAGYDVPTGATPVTVAANNQTAFDLAIEQLSLSHIRGQLLTEGGDQIAYWKVFADLDEDGSRGDDEPMAVSDRNGDYALTGLAAGTYKIRPELPAGWSDTAGRDGLLVTLAADEIAAGNDFLLKPTNTSVTGGVHFVTMPSTNIEARQTFRYSAIAMSLGHEALRYDLSLAPDGMTIDANTGLTAWRPSIDQVGEHLVILRATSASGSISLHDFYLTVTAPNTPPAISGIGTLPVSGGIGILPVSSGIGILPVNNFAYIGSNYTYDIIAQDAESQQLTYSLAQAPAGATIDATTGRLNWTPSAADVGSHDFTVAVTDEAGATTTATWTVDVQSSAPTDLPLDVTLPRKSAAVTANYISRIHGSDALGRPITWALLSGPAGMSIDADGNIQWTPATNQLGTQAIELNCTTPDGNSQAVNFSIEVAGRALNAAPIIDSQPTTSIALGQTFAYDVRVSDTDRDIFSFALLEAPVGMSIHPSLGTIRWTPSADQLGESNVVVQVSDPSGDTATQEFKLKVSRFGGPPRITSVPPTAASVGNAFLYSVAAVDRESGPLSYTLLAAPTGMSIVETTGEISWTPAADQLGQQDVVIQVSDGIGGAATQAFTINVTAGAANLPPKITSSSPRFGAVGTAFNYTLTATDPENTTIAYRLGRGPTGMTVDASTGQVAWTPTADQAGKHVVTLIATDSGGASALESFEFDVLAQNTAPLINSVPLVEVAAGAVFMYDVLASDADRDQLVFELAESPAGATIDSFGRIRWQTQVALIGAHDFRVKVRDPRGGEAMQSFTLDVIEDLVPPKLSLIENLGFGSRNILPWQGPFRVFVKAIDNVAVASLTLKANGKDIALDASGTATFTFQDWTFQSIVATATAIDTNGNITTKSITFGYSFPEGWSGAGTEDIPTAAITSPSDTQSVTGMVSTVGTAAHADLFGYKLSYRHVDQTSFTQFHESTTAVTDGELGVWDTSLLLNDEYVIRLEVATHAGVVNVVEHHVGLAGELKLGNFRLSFTDMVIPVAGIPIEITRIYDTLQADRQGDFGYGWRLEYRNTDLRVGLPKSGLEDIGIYSALRPGVKVYLNVPGQGRQGFTFNPDIRVLPGFGGQNLVLARPKFTPDRGVTSTLSTGTSGYLQVNELGELYAPGGIPYNPASPNFGGAYVLTTRAGITYRISGQNGDLQSTSDRNGNQVRFTDSAILGPAGVQVDILRDAQGRVVAVSDLEGNQTQYEYDANGDLSEFVDREANETTYRYLPRSSGNFRAHYLDEVIDPLGRVGAKSIYGEDGRLTSLVNVNGVEISLVHDIGNSQERIVDGNGNPEFFEYNNFGSVTSLTNSLGHRTEYEYDTNGNRTAEINALGNRIEFSYNTAGILTRIRDAAGGLTTYTYDASGNRLTATGPTGQTISSVYDDRGNLLAVSNGEGQVLQQQFDDQGNIVVATNANGDQITSTFDARGNRTSETDLVGLTRQYQYDVNGMEVANRVQQMLNGETVTLIHTDTRDLNGRIVGSVDALGGKFRQTLDANGNIVSVTNQEGRSIDINGHDRPVPELFAYADQSTSQQVYDANNNVIQTINQNGATTSYRYDAVNNLIAIFQSDDTPSDDSDNPVSSFEYDAIGNQIASIDPRGNRTEYEYDSLGRRTLVRNPLGAETRYKYDALGNTTKIVDAQGNETWFEFNLLNQATLTRFADGTSSEFDYNDQGQLISRKDGNGYETRFDLNALGQVISVIDAEDGVTRFEYDSFGNLITEEDALGNRIVHEYDALSHRVATIYPDGSRQGYNYDSSSVLVSSTDLAGNVSTYQYDSVGRLAKETYADGSESLFEYDSVGRITRVIDRDSDSNESVTTWTYDARGQLVQRTESDSQSIEFDYDLNGNLIALTTPFQTTIYEYDAANRLWSVSVNGQTLVEYAYDSLGRVVGLAFDNGATETRSYDAVGRLLTQVTSVGSENLIEIHYTYDSDGNVITKSRTDQRITEERKFNYDRLNRLIQEVVGVSGEEVQRIAYRYDAVGNRTEKLTGDSFVIYSYDNRNALASELISDNGAETLVTYIYDANGQLTDQTNSAGEATSYDWDLRGRLSEITQTDGSDLQRVQYEYSGDGLRIGRVVLDGSNQVVDQSRFLWETAGNIPQIISEYDSGGISIRQFVQGATPVATQTSEGVRFYHQDVVGSTMLLTDSNGEIVESYRYDAFGVQESASTSDQPIRFAGEMVDPVTNLTYLRARDIDRALGRFLSIDPLEGSSLDPMSRHDYVYGHSNPLRYTDPTGQASLAEQVVTFAIQSTLLLVGLAGLQQVYSHTIGGTPVNWQGLTGSLSFGATWGPSTGSDKVTIGAQGGFYIGASLVASSPYTRTGGEQQPYGAALVHIGTYAGVGGSYSPFEFGVGVGSINVDVPGAQWLKDLGSAALAPFYAILLDVNVSAGPGLTPYSKLWMGFGDGYADGRSIGNSFGISLTFVGALTIPFPSVELERAEYSSWLSFVKRWGL